MGEKERLDQVYELLHDWRNESKENLRQSKILFTIMVLVLSLSGAASLWSVIMILRLHF